MRSVLRRVRLTHKIAAIGAAGVLGLVVVGVVYFIETRLQESY